MRRICLAWVSTAQRLPVVGRLVRIRGQDRFGKFELAESKYFLHDDGAWYCTKPPTKMACKVSDWQDDGE